MVSAPLWASISSPVRWRRCKGLGGVLIFSYCFYLSPGKPVSQVPEPAPPTGLVTGLPWAKMRLASEVGWRIVGARGAAGSRCPQVLGVRVEVWAGPPRVTNTREVHSAPFGHTAPPPPIRGGRDRFCLKEIAAQQVRTRLGSGMWKYDSEQLRRRAASAARLEPARPCQGERGERGPGAGPQAGGGPGPGRSPRLLHQPRGPSRASRTSCQGNFNMSG